MLSNSTGKTLVGIRRVLYVHKGVVQNGAGPLELTFDDGTSVVLDAGADGESLAVMAGSWIDPFQEPLSEENQLFIESSGKWTAFDMATLDPFSRAIGHAIDQVDDLRSPSEKVVGTCVRLGDVVILANVDSDELLVDVA